MIPVIPKKRKDGKSSFGDLVAYVSVRDDKKDEDLIVALQTAGDKPEDSHRNRFSRLVDYATKLRDESFVSLVDMMPDGGEWVNFYGVTCFHNCTSIETAAEEMEYTARQAKYSRKNSDPVFHYMLSWQAHESPRPEQIYDSVRHSLKALGLNEHQFVSAVHTDTDNLHVHVAVNRVHPETGYLNRVSWGIEKLHKACRQLELKHGFATDNGCYVIGPENRIVRRTSQERDRLSAWNQGQPRSLKEYIADTTIAGLRETPADSWNDMHQKLAKAGLFLQLDNDVLKVKDGWSPERPGVTLSSFGHSWSNAKLNARYGTFTPPAQDIFKHVDDVGRYDPEQVSEPTRPTKMAEGNSLRDYIREKVLGDLLRLDEDRDQRNVQRIHEVFARAGLYLQEQHGRLVVCDAYNKECTPVRAETVWPALTKPILDDWNGGWKPVPHDIFSQVQPASQFTGGELEAVPMSNREWNRLRTGPGPQGAVKREIFSDKESLWGYCVSHCRRDIEALIQDKQFTWERCHDVFARHGLLLITQGNGLVVMDAYNHDQTPVKASHVHPDLTLFRAEPHADKFRPVPADIFERVAPQSRYNPSLAVSDRDVPGMKRDPELRQQQREARAAAREDLKARYAAWRSRWQRPDLNTRERYQVIHAECRMRKANIRLQHSDPLLRKLSYHIAEVQRMQALIQLKEDIKAERLELVGQGKWYPPSYKQWVEMQALRGDKAAISQMRGWDYRDRRHDNSRTTTADRCVVICEPGGSPLYMNAPGLTASLQKNGSVRFRHAESGEHVCTDFGDRVVFRNHADFASLQRELNQVSPVLFCRDPKMGFAPEGRNEMFNHAVAEMVGWYNVHGAGDHDQFHISRPDIDRVRAECEQYFRDDLSRGHSQADERYEQRNDWEPPSPM